MHPTEGGTDSPEAVRFKQALDDVYTAFNAAIDAGAVAGADEHGTVGAVAEATMDGLHPDVTVPRRALGGIALPGRLIPEPPTPPVGSRVRRPARAARRRRPRRARRRIRSAR